MRTLIVLLLILSSQLSAQSCTVLPVYDPTLPVSVFPCGTWLPPLFSPYIPPGTISSPTLNALVPTGFPLLPGDALAVVSLGGIDDSLVITLRVSTAVLALAGFPQFSPVHGAVFAHVVLDFNICCTAFNQTPFGLMMMGISVVQFEVHPTVFGLNVWNPAPNSPSGTLDATPLVITTLPAFFSAFIGLPVRAQAFYCIPDAAGNYVGYHSTPQIVIII